LSARSFRNCRRPTGERPIGAPDLGRAGARGDLAPAVGEAFLDALGEAAGILLRQVRLESIGGGPADARRDLAPSHA